MRIDTTTKQKFSELVSVEIKAGYLEFTMNNNVIYDFRATDLAKFLPQLRSKTWFTPELEAKSNLLVTGEVING